MKTHIIYFIKFILIFIFIPISFLFGFFYMFLKLPLCIIELGSNFFDDIFGPHIPKKILKIFPFLKS